MYNLLIKLALYPICLAKIYGTTPFVPLLAPIQNVALALCEALKGGVFIVPSRDSARPLLSE